MSTRDKPYTVDDLAAFAALPENEGKKFELIEGVIYDVTTGSPLHGLLILWLASRLLNFALEHQLGLVFSDNVTYELSVGDEFVPDISFVAHVDPQSLPDKRFYTAPDLAIEVVSPSNHPLDLLLKIERYFHFGTQQVWIIYPEGQAVWIYQAQGDGSLVLRKLGLDDTLDGGAILPGFSLPIRQLFTIGQA